MSKHRIYTMTLAGVYPHYLTKVECKGRTQAELDQVLCWLTGYSPAELQQVMDTKVNFEDLFAQAPALNPARKLITGSVCGVKLAEIDDPLMLEVRYMDKLVDELAKGKPLEKILRKV